MGIDEEKGRSAADLRRSAEARLSARAPKARPVPSEHETQRLLHELQVHEIELELQNAELRQARVEVETVLGRYTNLYDLAPVGYFTLNRKGGVSAVNLSGADLLGVERSRLIGRRFGRFVATTDQPAFAAFLGTVFDCEGKAACDVSLTAEGASALFVHIEAVAFAPGDESFVAVTDLTGRKRAEEEAQQTAARLAWVLERTGVGLWHNALPLGRLGWDEQTRRLFFVDPGAEPTIELFWSRLHPGDCEPTRLAVEKAIRERTLYDIEHRVQDPATGELRWLHSAGQATYGEDGTPVGFDGINYDITARKQAEEQIQEYVEELRATNEELTRFNKASVGRELRMIELKREVNELVVQSGQPPRYPLAFEGA